jgi:hypothetical protein
MEAGVDDFHSCIAECRCDYLGTAVMSIQTRFGDENSNGSHREVKVSGCDVRAAIVSLFARYEKHLGRSAPEWVVLETVECLLDHQSCFRAKLG